MEAIAASFPPGSVTGAPKIAAMQFIQQLEPMHREIYTGTIGYISQDGKANFNVAIRTIVSKANLASYHLGAGIVADSDPLKEWNETLVKGVAMAENLCQE